MSRDFMGEKAKGVWTVEISTVGCIEQGFIKSMSLLFTGTNETTRKSMQSISKNVKITPLSPRFSFIEKKIRVNCGEDVKIEMQILPEDEGKVIGFFIENIKTKRRMFLCSKILKSTIEIQFPCIFQEKEWNLIAESRELNEYASVPIRIKTMNVREEGIISPLKYQNFFKSPNENVTIDLRWQFLMDDLPKSEWGKNVIISVFDMKKRKVMKLKKTKNTGKSKIVIKSDFQCPQCLIVITPVSHSSDSTCTTLTVPIHILREGEKPPMNEEPFGFDPCSQRMIQKSSISAKIRNFFSFDVILLIVLFVLAIFIFTFSFNRQIRRIKLPIGKRIGDEDQLLSDETIL